MVDRSRIKSAIDDWTGWYLRVSSTLIPRHTAVRATGASAARKACAYVGVRRCGKICMALQAARDSGISPERILYFNFEDPVVFMEEGPAILDDIISVYTEYATRTPQWVVFDEIHNVDGWEKWVRKAVDMEQFRLHITGSSAKMLSSELSTAIAGRNIEIPVWPLSFAEHIQFTGKSPSHRNEYVSAVRDYLTWGGFPEVVLTPDPADKKDILRQYVNDIVLKDVIGRNEIRNKHLLDRLVIYYFTNVSSFHSANSAGKALQINTEAVADYTSFLSDAFLFFEVRRYHHNLKVQARDMKKIYCIDTGMRNVHSVSPFNDEMGRLAENAVYIHLRRLGREVWYYKGDAEADFVITHLGKPREVIQVCYADLEDSKTRDREIGGLLEALAYTGLEEGTVLTLSRQEKIRKNGKIIHCIPLHQWMLGAQ